MSERQVIDDPTASRFEIRVGGQVASFAEYRRDGSAMAFIHTVVEPQFEGKGIGSALARGALDAARSSGAAVLPFCPFIRSYVQRHPVYLNLVPADRRAAFALTLGDPAPDHP